MLETKIYIVSEMKQKTENINRRYKEEPKEDVPKKEIKQKPQ